MNHLFAPWRHSWVTAASEADGGGAAPGGECLFCRVWNAPDDDEPNLVVHRGALGLVMLNRYPYNGGHLLIVPREHRATLQGLSAASRADLMELAARSLEALSRHHRPEGFNLGVNQGRAAGAGIPDHVHLHIVPRWTGDTNFMSTVGQTRVVSEDLNLARRELAALFAGGTAP